MKFRTTVTEADVTAIRAMVAEADVFSEEEINVAEELAQDAATLGKESHYHFILAEVEGVLTGYTCYGRIPLTDERYDLYWIVTDASQQRRGVASELMQRTEKSIRALGGKAIYAETSSRTIYKPAQRFYIKQGFTLAAEVKDFYRKGDDKLLYCRAL
jgi:ribosomal protein S18 acetylase RimI-like enzyme